MKCAVFFAIICTMTACSDEDFFRVEECSQNATDEAVRLAEIQIGSSCHLEQEAEDQLHDDLYSCNDGTELFARAGRVEAYDDNALVQFKHLGSVICENIETSGCPSCVISGF